jgi:hypothetical protein
METLQNLLTIAAEATVIAGITGIIAHALYSSHRNFMMEFCPPVAPCQSEVKEAIAVVEIEQPAEQPEAEAVTEVAPVVEAATEVVPVVEAVKEAPKVVTTRKTRSKKVSQAKLQPMSVGAAAVNYNEMTSEQLRKECALQFIDWRTGGDYGKPMKKAQMLAALS